MPEADFAPIVIKPWDVFVERFGVSTVVGMLAAILGICWVQNAGITPTEGVAGMQLLLAMIVLGCVGVLSYRTPSTATVAAQHSQTS